MEQGLNQATVVQEHFKGASRQWGARYGGRPGKMSDLDLLLRREAVHRHLRPLLNNAEGPLRVLDLGCGSGDVLNGIPRSALKVTGMDFVPEMVSCAAKDHPSDSFLVGSVLQLPFASDSADVVTCLGVLEYLPDADQALREFCRVLRPSGHLIASFPNRISLFRRLSVPEIRLERAALRALAAMRGKTRAADANPKYAHRAWSTRQIKDSLSQGGFSQTGLLFHTYGLWGIAGRCRPSLWLSDWMSKRLSRDSAISRTLACTIVAIARKPIVDDKVSTP